MTLRALFLQIERERSKERLENKRRQDQLKKVFDEEKEENKKKLSEVSENRILSNLNTFVRVCFRNIVVKN